MLRKGVLLRIVKKQKGSDETQNGDTTANVGLATINSAIVAYHGSLS